MMHLLQYHHLLDSSSLNLLRICILRLTETIQYLTQMLPAHAESKPIGKVVSSDVRDSITKDFANKFLLENGVNEAVTSIVSDNGAGLAHCIPDC